MVLLPDRRHLDCHAGGVGENPMSNVPSQKVLLMRLYNKVLKMKRELDSVVVDLTHVTSGRDVYLRDLRLIERRLQKLRDDAQDAQFRSLCIADVLTGVPFAVISKVPMSIERNPLDLTKKDL